MSVRGVRKYQDLAGWAPERPPRREIGPDILAYARAKRDLGWGWQTIANCCAVNETDLRRAMGDLPGATHPPVATQPHRKLDDFAARDRARRPGSAGRAEARARRLSVLGAIEAGARTPAEVAAALGWPDTWVHADFVTLRRQGAIEGHCRDGGAVRLTEAGRAWLAEPIDVDPVQGGGA